MSTISSKKSVHADKTGCICSRRCQVTITHSNTKESKRIKESDLDVKDMVCRQGCESPPGESLNLYDDDDSFVSRRSLSPSADLKRSLISRLTARRRVGEELHTCNTGSLGHVQGHGLRASQAASGRALGMNGGGELWTTRAQPWCRSASGSGESWRKPWMCPHGLGSRGNFYIHGV